MRSRRITMVAAGALVFSVLSGAPTWAAGPFQVDTAADSVDANPGDGQCSLRAAVQEANASGGGEIHLQRAATYVLTVGGTGEDAAATGDLDVTSSISIEAAAPRSTRTGSTGSST
ncbi:MAG: CSLREA domain-containing protein [Actinomycetota bacterium]|nr:CSLREA domain-containing protein [Actinomycetota bacterium]